MAGNKKPRKAYRPRRQDPAAAGNALMRANMSQSTAPMDRDAQVLHSALYRGALVDLMRGTGDAQTAATHLAIAANLAMVLCEDGFGAECLSDVKASQAAIVRLMDRGNATGRWVLAGPEIEAIRVMLDIHEQQLEAEQCTVGVWAAAVSAICKRMSAGQLLRVTSAGFAA